MKVIHIWVEPYGFISTVASYEAAIHFLVTNHWIEGNNELYEWDNEALEGSSILIQEKLGKDWVNNLLKNFDIDSFNKLFDAWIELKETEVYDKTFEKEN